MKDLSEELKARQKSERKINERKRDGPIVNKRKKAFSVPIVS